MISRNNFIKKKDIIDSIYLGKLPLENTHIE